MKQSVESVVGCFGIVIIAVFFIVVICGVAIILSDKPPVKEDMHRELVTTIDSILDARFGTGCCDEVIDSDDVTVPIDSFGRVVLPDNWQ